MTLNLPVCQEGLLDFKSKISEVSVGGIPPATMTFEVIVAHPKLLLAILISGPGVLFKVWRSKKVVLLEEYPLL